MDIKNVCLYLLMVVKWCYSANILYIMPFTSRSHYIMLKPIGLELAKRGHNVTVITGYKDTNPPPNYHQVTVDTKEIWDVVGGGRPNVFTMVEISAEKFHKQILWRGGLGFTEVALNSSEVQQFLSEDHTFDLVVAEQFFQEALNILAYKYQCPLVLVTTFGNCMKHNIVTRNPLQLATVLSEFLDVRHPASFWARLRNFYFTSYEYFWWRYWYLDEQEKLMRKYIKDLPEPVPGLYDVQKNASLILLNGHFSFGAPTAYLPNVIEIGGVHLSKVKTELPGDLKQILDNAQHGVVYVNFGSNVRSSELPAEKRNAFLSVFRRLKHTVLWKWEDDNFENKPNNLVVRKWMPQSNILSHPNVKVFISHGGLIGTQEAIFYGVPLIGVPIYGDQYNNLLQAEQMGFGKILEYHNICEETLDKALDDVLTNDSYITRAKEVSVIFKDRPLSALDTAMFWIEYVIRHNGANYIKNPARDFSWIVYTMLDVYGAILIISLASAYVILKFVKILLNITKKTNMKDIKVD